MKQTLEDGILERLLKYHRDSCCTFIQWDMSASKINRRCKKYLSKESHCDACVADYIRKNKKELLDA